LGTVPTTTNQAATTFEGIASEVVIDLLLPAAETALEAAAEVQAPILGAPVLKQVFEGLTNEAMSLMAHALLTALVESGVKIIITIQTEAEKSAYAAAEGRLRAALLTKDAAQVAAARKVFEDAADSIVHSDGWLGQHH
jgi:hypothetical protein